MNKKKFILTAILLSILLVSTVIGAVIFARIKSRPKNQPVNNQTKNNLTIKNFWQIKIDNPAHDYYSDLSIVNPKTGEGRFLGKISTYVSERGVITTPGGERVIFLGASSGDETGENVIVYSTTKNKVVQKIKLDEIKTALPSLHIPRNASLNYLTLSPTGGKIAMNYGYSLETDYESDIIVIDLSTRQIRTVNVKGIVTGWKNDETISYQTPTTEYAQESLYPKKIIKEVKILP